MHSSNSPCNLYNGTGFPDRPKINGTLLKTPCTLSVISRLPLEIIFWICIPRTLPANPTHGASFLRSVNNTGQQRFCPMRENVSDVFLGAEFKYVSRISLSPTLSRCIGLCESTSLHCCFCLTSNTVVTAQSKHTVQYPNLPYAMRPVPHIAE